MLYLFALSAYADVKVPISTDNAHVVALDLDIISAVLHMLPENLFAGRVLCAYAEYLTK
jgi:hypothetical protein